MLSSSKIYEVSTGQVIDLCQTRGTLVVATVKAPGQLFIEQSETADFQSSHRLAGSSVTVNSDGVGKLVVWDVSKSKQFIRIASEPAGVCSAIAISYGHSFVPTLPDESELTRRVLVAVPEL